MEQGLPLFVFPSSLNHTIDINRLIPFQAVRSMIHTSLLKVEAVYERYTSVITEKSPLPEPRIYEVRLMQYLLESSLILAIASDCTLRHSTTCGAEV